MAGPNDILQLGLGALNASNAGVRTAGHNIANVGTPGFHRRENVYETAAPASNGRLWLPRGVEMAGARRIMDEALCGRARASRAEADAAGRRSEVLGRAEAIFGDLDGRGIAAAVDELFGAFNALAAAPQDAQARDRALAAAEGVSAEVSGRAEDIARLMRDLNQSIEADVSSANALAERVAALNKKIVETPGAADDVMDLREKAVDELAAITGAVSLANEDGTVTLLAPDGFAMVSGVSAKQLAAEAGVDGLDRVFGVGGGARHDLTARLSSGTLGGTLSARDTDLRAAAEGLDAFAFAFANAVNATHSAGAGLDGVAGRPLFEPPVLQAGSAGRLRVDAALSGQPDRLAAALDPAMLPGDNTNALALHALRESPVVNGRTPGAAFRGILTDLGVAGRDERNASVALDAAAARLRELEQTVSGVSLDEEMVALMRFRESFTAASQLIKTADEMIQEILSIKR